MPRIVLFTTFILLVSTPFSFAEEQKIVVSFDVPASNYKVTIQSVHQAGDEVWVVSEVAGGGIGLQVISKASDEITLDEKVEGKIIHKVLGKSWNWGKDTKTLQYVKDTNVLKDELKEKGAKLIWKREKPKAE